MATYRLYCLDRLNRFVDAAWLEARDDAEATALARGNATKCVTRELWVGDRLVVRLPGEPQRPHISEAETGD